MLLISLLLLLLSLLHTKLLLMLLHQPILMGILLKQLLLLGIEIGLVLLQILEHLQLLLVEIEVWQGGLWSAAVLLLETLVRCCIISGELCLIILEVEVIEFGISFNYQRSESSISRTYFSKVLKINSLCALPN